MVKTEPSGLTLALTAETRKILDLLKKERRTGEVCKIKTLMELSLDPLERLVHKKWICFSMCRFVCKKVNMWISLLDYGRTVNLLYQIRLENANIGF